MQGRLVQNNLLPLFDGRFKKINQYLPLIRVRNMILKSGQDIHAPFQREEELVIDVLQHGYIIKYYFFFLG